MSVQKDFQELVAFLKKRKKVLIVTTSNRWSNDNDIPKSSLLALEVKKNLGKKAEIIDITKLKIYPCEGNVSSSKGNSCGIAEAVLKGKRKNPSGCHRCWASINNKDDELWKVSKKLLDSEVVVFFGSVRWGQMNAEYQKLIERLTWLENRHTALQEKNIIKDIYAGLVCFGQNWNSAKVLETQKKVLEYFGFRINKKLFLNWQYTKNSDDESLESYKKSRSKFRKDFGI